MVTMLIVLHFAAVVLFLGGIELANRSRKRQFASLLSRTENPFESPEELKRAA
jgi:hypothetical protein